MSGCCNVKKIITTEEAPKAIGPYSQAVEANGFVFLSGQIPVEPYTGALITGTVEEQTIQVLKNIEAVLNTAGCSFDNVVKTTVYLKNMNDFAKMNEVYSRFFKAEYPARACVEVSRLPKDVAVEIDLIAKK